MRWVVRGGRRLAGTVEVGPAKNALLPALAAALLTDERVVLAPAARMRDVCAMADLLSGLGADVVWTEAGGVPALSIQARGPLRPDAPDEAVGRMRASVLVLGPLLVRCGRAVLADPGGCAIGTRPIDLHLLAMGAMGAEVRQAGRRVELRAPRGLTGGVVRLPYPSHTATENALLAACGARGPTTIVGAAREPEVADLAAMLGAMGASVRGAGGPVIRIEPPRSLHGTCHRPLPDRIEAGTLLLAGAVACAAGGEEGDGGVAVSCSEPAHMGALLRRLRAAGFLVRAEAGQVRLDRGPRRPRAVDVRTQPYPGFPTDLQPQFTVLAAVSAGRALVEETIFDRRLEHLRSLARMGARVHLYGTRFARIDGPAALLGRTVQAADLRGGAALVLAGLAAEGETIVEDAGHIARGYADLPAKLRALGADVEAAEPAGLALGGPL